MPESKLVYIVDDDVDFLRASERLLNAHDLNVRTFACAEEFRSQANPDDAACIIMDVHLGCVTGIDLMRKLSRRGTTTPVILVSGDDAEQTRRAAITAGCSDFLQKPISATSLMDAIRKAVRISVR